MILELCSLLIFFIHLIIDLISWVIAYVLTVFVVIYSIVLIRRLFKTQIVVKPEGKAVLITGCDSGFGYQLALNLNSLGFRVYATVLEVGSAHKLIEKSQFKQQMVVWKMDVTDEEEVKGVYEKVIQDLQLNDSILWAVVNNAGFGIIGQLEWVDLADIQRLFEVNVFGLVGVTRTFLPLIRHSKGHVVNMCSQVGLISLNGYGPYSMSKYAAKAFNDGLRQEMNKFGVKVSALYPCGYKDTNFLESFIKSSDRIWAQLEDSLKHSYGGDEYYEIWKKKISFQTLYYSGDKSIMVIDAAVDAIVNVEPQISYSPISLNIMGKLMYNLLRIVPSFILDLYDSY